MIKIYAHTFWFQWGEEFDKGPRFAKCWLRSVAPPFYEGTGVAIRLGKHSLRLGIASAQERPVTAPDLAEPKLEVLLGRELRFRPEEVSKWRGSINGVLEQEEGTGSDSDTGSVDQASESAL